MTILAVDTALGALSAALWAEGRVLAHEHRDMVRGHAEALAPMVQKLMREAGLGFTAIGRIAVTTGPGTFTGQRVGLAFARALGLALKKPVIGITTLDAMAEEALGTDMSCPWAAVAADAKRGEIYFGARTRTRSLREPVLVPLADVRALLEPLIAREGAVFLIAGTAAEALMAQLADAGLRPKDSGVRQPDAVAVARLAASAPEGAPPKPLYLRPPDAKLPSAP